MKSISDVLSTGLTVPTPFQPPILSVRGAEVLVPNLRPTWYPAAAATTPPRLALQASAGVLTLSWSADYHGWWLQLQTNTPSGGPGSNRFTLLGSDWVTTTNLALGLAGAWSFSVCLRREYWRK